MSLGHACATLAVLVAAAQLFVTTGRVIVAAVAAALAAASWLHRRSFHAGSAVEVLAALALGVIGTVLHGIAPETTGQGSFPLRSAVFVFAFTGLMMAALRLHFARPEAGLPGTMAAAGLVFLACGTVRSGAWMPVLFGVFLLLAFSATSLDAWRLGVAPAPWQFRGRAAVVAAVIVVGVPVLMWTWGETGPRLVRSGTSAMLEMIGPPRRTGFHEGAISLHALDGLSQSDQVVMRIDGQTGEHLRGNVYVDYEQGRWLPLGTDPAIGTDPLRLASSPRAADRQARIEYVESKAEHFFLPLGARPHRVEPETATVDAWQLVRADEGEPEAAEFAWPRSHGGPSAEALAFDPAWPGPPGERDIALPDELREPLQRVSARLAGATPMEPEARARRLESALATGFEYSTSFRDAWSKARRARPRVDPVLLFLEDLQAGHCEYFGSGLALLLRSEGIPARLVSGYRVAERNPIGGWAVVRERHAHVWVEAHLPGRGWVTLDGTPIAAETAAAGLASTPRFAAIVDWLGRQARVHGRAVLLGVLVVGLAGAQVARLVRGRLGRAGHAGGRSRPIARALQSLLERLGDAGFARDHGETLESLARRLRASDDGAALTLPDPAFIEAADLLDRYAALRYGGIGHRVSLEAALSGWPEPPVDHSSG